MNSRVGEIVAEMKGYGNEIYISRQAGLMGELLSIISEEQAQSAQKLEKQTTSLIRLTWSLVVLTLALLFFTVVLYQDAHEATEREKLQEHTKLQDAKLPPQPVAPTIKSP